MLINILRKELASNRGRTIKVQAKISIEMIKLNELNQIESTLSTYFSSNTESCRNKKDAGLIMANLYQAIESKIASFVERGSGWVIR